MLKVLKGAKKIKYMAHEENVIGRHRYREKDFNALVT